MTSERKRKANAANGAKSRGPVTPEGKAVSRLNAMKHGIYSEMTVVSFEEEGPLVAFGKRLRAELAPVGELELMLADRAVSLAWRLRRLTEVESDMMEYAVEGTSYEQGNLRRMFTGSSGEQLLRLGQYEAKIDRQLTRTLHELERLQERRKGAHVPAPTAVDVVISGTVTGAGTVGSFRRSAEIPGDCAVLPEDQEIRAFPGDTVSGGV